MTNRSEIRDDVAVVLDALRARGHRMTPQRRAIVLEIMASEGHISPQEIAGRVQRRVPGVNTSTVYRTLDLLEEAGYLSHSHHERGHDYHHASEHDHVHLTCSACGHSESLSLEEIEPLRTLVARHNGFLPDFTHFAISGICARCQRSAET
jgi:Fur family ferric uptake transcriptional regulator